MSAPLHEANWYIREGEKKSPPCIIWDTVNIDGVQVSTVSMVDVICAYIDAGYSGAEVLQVPEVKLMYRQYHQKRISKILNQRNAFRLASHAWFAR